MNTVEALNSLSTYQSALWLFDDLQLNVFPLPYGRKYGSPWKALKYTRLDRNHPFYGLKALTGTRCNLAVMVGRTSGNLFVLDYETVSGLTMAIRICQQNHIPVWAALTTRGGHLWFRCADGVVKSLRGKEMEVRGSNGYVLAPPSFNEQSGVTYSWLLREGDEIPVVTTDDLKCLSLPLETERTVRKTGTNAPTLCPRSTSGRFLNRSTQRYLELGRTYPRGTRHIAYFYACCDYMEKGYSYGDIERDLMPIARASGLPDDGDSQVLHRVALWAYKHVHPRDAYTTRRSIFSWQKALTFLIGCKWEGQQGSTDRAVALALIARAKQFTNENGTFRASYREIRELAHIGNNQTVKKSLARLKAIPFVCYAGADGDTRATLWRFSDFVQRTNGAESEPLQLNTGVYSLNAPACNSSNGSLTTLLDMLQSDALERGALGITGWWVYMTLLGSASPTAFKDIAERAGLSEGQVRYALRKGGWLRKTGLVERVKSGWLAKAVTRKQLDDLVARPAGKLGKSAKRAAAFAKERAINAGREIAFAQRKRTVIRPIVKPTSSFVYSAANSASIFVPYRE